MKRMPQLRRLLPLLALAASLQITLGYYDPAAQRWINRDPLGEPAALNLYSVVQNDALNWVDDLGERAIRPGFGRPGGRNPYCYPNGRPILALPPPQSPNYGWPVGRPPSMCITMYIPGSNQSGEHAVRDGVVQEWWDAIRPPGQVPLPPAISPLPPPPIAPAPLPPSPVPPRPPAFGVLPPNSQSCVNAPPDIGIITPPKPPRTVIVPGDKPVLVSPGTEVIRY
jgi:hypothetical protein